ncbi:MAG: hypothetical protein Ta2D_00320 [Rickettsiales bacterium]|nr:MAG: hypothetical protein Ta2D_00320 [Rickettsiales bacterium]
MTKHIEVHGDNWGAIFPLSGEEEAENFAKLFKICVEGGKIQEKLISDDKVLTPLLYPENNSLCGCSLIETKEQNNLIVLFPFMEGLPNKLKIVDNYTWKNGYEGEITALFEEDREIDFFAPFYYKQLKDFKKDETKEVYISGLVHQIEKTNREDIVLTEGNLYDSMLQEFLDKNPNKTKADFENPVIKVGNMLMHLEHNTLYGFSTRIVDDVEWIEFCDEKIAKMKIIGYDSFEGNDNLVINLYASKGVLKDFEPKKGDDITGYCWLNGYLKY